MSEESTSKGGAKSLISSILKKADPVPSQGGDDGPVSDGDSTESIEPIADGELELIEPTEEELDIASLIEVYFDLEEPEERDALFDQITAIDSPLAEQFLETMFQEDNDYFVRSSAAAKLAGRGHPEAVALLERDLQDPQELFFFAQASQILGVIIGPSFYDTLLPIWEDAERSPEIRQEALLGMETANPEKTCTAALKYLNTIESVEHFPEEKIETAVLIFARNGFAPGIAPLQKLVAMVQKSALSEEDQEEHLGFLQEALDILQNPED